MRNRLFSLSCLIVAILLLVGCGVSAGPETAQLAFEAQMNVDSGQQFHVSLGVRNVGGARFREYDAFNGTMALRDDAGEEVGRISVATLWELAPGSTVWPAVYASRLPAGGYQLTWGAPDHGAVRVDFTIVELDGRLYLGEESVQSTAVVTDDERLLLVPTERPAPQGTITIKEVQVTAGEQIIVQGQSTLPEGTCLGSELWADGELQDWWPGETCVPVQNGGWQMTIRLGSGKVPAELDPSAQYMLRVYQQNGPDVVSVFAFDLAGPPAAGP